MITGIYLQVLLWAAGGLFAMLAAIHAINAIRNLYAKGGAMMVALIAAAVWFGHFPTQAEKGSSGGSSDGVIFYHTDPDITYLSDRGSRVYPDYVDISMKIKYLPNDARIQLWSTPKAVTNWVCQSDESVADWSAYHNPELDLWNRRFDCENALSNRWCIFTTYIRPSAVQTNGVLHVLGIMPTNAAPGTVVGVPLHTGVNINGQDLDLKTKSNTINLTIGGDDE